MASQHAGNDRTRPIAEITYLLRYVVKLNASELRCILRHLLLLQQLSLTICKSLTDDSRRHDLWFLGSPSQALCETTSKPFTSLSEALRFRKPFVFLL